MLITVARNISS